MSKMNFILCFNRFSTKESAAHAIVAIHNGDVNGHTVKCSWGKESGDPNNLPANSQVSEVILHTNPKLLHFRYRVKTFYQVKNYSHVIGVQELLNMPCK